MIQGEFHAVYAVCNLINQTQMKYTPTNEPRKDDHQYYVEIDVLSS